MQNISGVGCMQARSGPQSSPPSVDLDAEPTSSVVDMSSPSSVDLEAESSSSVVDQDIPNNVGAAPVLGQNQAGQVRSHFDLSFYALVGQICRAW